MVSQPRIKLQHAVLRALEVGDEVSLALHGNTEAVHRYTSDAFPFPLSEDDARAFIDAARKSAWPSPESLAAVFGIEIDGAIVGVASLTQGTLNHRVSAELGYWLSEKHWGRGIMTEVAKVLTAWGFANLQVRRLFAPVYAPNRASARVLEKAGYELEATHRYAVIKNGTVMDELVYARYA